MRLITKINIHFGIILAALMVMVFTFTQHFFQKELETQMKSSLDVTYESFKLTLEQIFNEQKMKALNKPIRTLSASLPRTGSLRCSTIICHWQPKIIISI